MKTLQTNLSLISKDCFLRNDEKYHLMAVSQNDNLFSTPVKDNIPLSDVLREDYTPFCYEVGCEYKGIPTGQAYIDDDGDIIDYQPVTLDNHPGRLKYAISNDNILISSLRLAKSPALMFDDIDLSEFVFSNGFYIFSVKEGWHKKFVLHLLRSKRIKALIDNNLYRGIGISSYRVDDLLKCEIKHITLDVQKEAVKRIEPYEKEIRLLKQKAKKPQQIIDYVFESHFGFDYSRFNELKQIKTCEKRLSDYSNNPDLRFSSKFHRDAGTFVMNQLTDLTDKKIKHFISEPIVLGASITPNDFDENGSAYYVSMATIKTLEIELDESQLVSETYYCENIAKSLAQNDIIMARSGVAIGKTAIVKEQFNGVFADFTMRIRINAEKYNPEFAYYYFRSTYFQYLIEIFKKGLQNQNIFPTVVQEFPMIDISSGEQQRIVDEIHSEIDKQNKLKAQIASLREEIDKIIEDTALGGKTTNE